MNIAIILGSSNSQGNTYQLAKHFTEHNKATIFDLADFEMSFYDYQHKNQQDAFLPLIEKLLSFDHWVFASPVYWYAMSAQMKVFYDRITDLLTIDKSLGRQLKGKSCSLIATGVAETVPRCFVEPFQLTAQYLHMPYKGEFYHQYTDNNPIAPNENQLADFVKSIF